MGHQGFESRTITRKRNKNKHKINGLCIYCSKKVEKNKVMCKHHLDYHKKARIKLKSKIIGEEERE